MDPAAVNTFLDRFLALADGGFGLIGGDVRYVLNALIVISVTLSGAQWALAGEAPLAPFFRKVLFVGLFAFLINNWDFLATAINASGAMLGLKAGGGGLTLADLHNPGAIAGLGTDLFGRTVALGEGMNILTDFVTLATILIAAFCAMLGFFVLALQVFVALISFKLGSLAAFVALPWGVFSGTAWVAERPLGWVAGSAVRLFVLAFVASVSLAFADALPATLTLDEGGALNVLFFGLTVLALAWFAPALASEVVQGQPHLSAPDAVRAGVGAAVGAAAVGAGATWTAINAVRLGARGARALAAPRSTGAGPGGGSGGGAASGAGSASGRAGAIDYAAMRPRPSSSPPSQPSSGGAT